ncbi:MAG TPA: hypothetical protein VII99_04710 [Bacteroidia bacterium]
MKTTKFFSAAVLVLAAMSIGAKSNDSSAKGTENINCVSCGYTNDQIASYLRNCSHHHTVVSVQDNGNCTWTCGIENCGISTVYVQDNGIIWHGDVAGKCPY